MSNFPCSKGEWRVIPRQRKQHEESTGLKYTDVTGECHMQRGGKGGRRSKVAMGSGRTLSII